MELSGRWNTKNVSSYEAPNRVYPHSSHAVVPQCLECKARAVGAAALERARVAAVNTEQERLMNVWLLTKGLA